MKNKILKTLLCFVLFGLLLVTVSYAETTEYPTTVKENVSQYPTTGAFIIGSTRFDTQQAITASKLFKAGVNESNLYNDLGIDKEIDDTLYYYTPVGWMQLGEEPDFISEEAAAKLEANLNIFFENNEVKTLQVEYNGNIVDVDDKNVKYENGRFLVPATTFSFKFTETKVVDGKEVIVAQEATTNMDKAITTESGKVEEPVIGTVSEDYVAKVGSEYFKDLASAIAKSTTEDSIVLLNDIDLPTAVQITKKVTIELNGKNLSMTEEDISGDGVFYVKEGGDLTINGEGIVNGVGNNDYNMAIYAHNGKVTINGGTYTNIGATGKDPDHFDLIYAKGDKCSIVINGGWFEGETPAWLLNLSDKSGAKITVAGGTFVGFNPADNDCEDPKVSFLAEGYKVVVNGNEYTVKAIETTDVAMANGIAYTDLQTAVNEVEAGTTIKLLKSIDLPTAVQVTKKVTIELNGKNLTMTKDEAGDGVFYVKKGGDLTINGEGEVNGVGNNNYNMAIYAYNGKVTINGGTYTNVGAKDDGTGHFDLIYARGTAEIVINNGIFMGETSKWLLNQHDGTRASSSITVYGGKFIGYDPSKSDTEDEITNYVADGYESNGNGYNEFYVTKTQVQN